MEKENFIYDDEVPLGKAKNLKGQKFGRLIALYRVKNKGNLTMWKCKCDCGTIIEVSSGDLKRQHTQSCGCYQKEVVSIDITGMRFGKLIAIKPTEIRSGGYNIKWECQCDCGKKCLTTAHSLTCGLTKSCGCLISKGEKAIESLLIKAGILYKTQKTFDDCRFPNTNAKAKFDFYINNEYLLEYHGTQHYNNNSSGWNDAENLEKTQFRDRYKENWCKNNKIPLIVIPYSKLETLNLEDISLNATNFRVV